MADNTDTTRPGEAAAVEKATDLSWHGKQLTEAHARRLVAILYPVIAAAVREQAAQEIHPILLELSDMLDEDEGPVILAWAVDRLAEEVAARVARGSR